jgi:hypothetical protein
MGKDAGMTVDDGRLSKASGRRCMGSKFMKLQFFRKQFRATIVILLLVVFRVCSYLIREGFLTNINSQGMKRLAKENWANREYISSINWYRAAYSSAFEGGVRWEIYKIYNNRIDGLRKQGNFSKALDACWQATKVWDQEGVVSFKCTEIEREMMKQE